MSRFQILQIAIPIRGCATTVNQQIGTADEAAPARHEKLCQIAHLIRCSGSAGRHALNPAQIALFARPVQLVVGQWSVIMPGEMLLMVAPRHPQRVASYITRSTLQRLEY